MTSPSTSTTPSVTATVQTVTPEQAEKWLANMPTQRTVRRHKVRQYVADMQAGRWRVNGEPIILAADGKLLDGQHRLTAVVRAGRPVDIWYLRSEIIWHKPNPMPESVTDRPTKAHETVFLLSKSPRYVYDADAIAEPIAVSNAQRTTAHYDTADRYGAGNGGNGGLDSLAARMRAGGHTKRNARSVWTIATRPYRGAHFATMPPALAERCIKAGTSPQACETCGAAWVGVYKRDTAPREVAPSTLDRFGTGDAGVHRKIGGQYQKWLDENPKTLREYKPTCACAENTGAGRCMVLDPFAGAGTTLLVADRLGRDGVGCELNPAYAALAEQRIRGDAPLFATPDGAA